MMVPADSTMPWSILRPRPSGALPPPPSGEPSFPQHGDDCRFFTIANQPIRPPVTNSQAVHRTFCLSKSRCSKYKPFAMAGTIWKQLQRKSTSQCLERKHWIVLIFYLGIPFFLISWNSGIKILVHFQFSAFLRRGKIQVGHSTGSCAIWKLNKFVTRMEEQLEKSIAALQVWMFHPWIYLHFSLLLRCTVDHGRSNLWIITINYCFSCFLVSVTFLCDCPFPSKSPNFQAEHKTKLAKLRA